MFISCKNINIFTKAEKICSYTKVIMTYVQISLFLQLFWLQQICLFKSSLTKGKVLHTAVKMENVIYLEGGWD